MKPGSPRTRRHLRGVLLFSVVLAAGPLAGCSPAPELNHETARQLQSQVLALTEAAAANDPGASLDQLEQLVIKLDGAAARGEVTFQRHQSIKAAIDDVRADLTAQQSAAEAAQAEAAAAAEAARVAAEQVAAEQEAAAQAAAAAAAAAATAAASVPPPAMVPGPSAPAGNGNSSNGKAKSKPKGKE